MTHLPYLSRVRLITDRYRDHGVSSGTTGTILEVYEDAYEVEFSRPDGTTIDWFAVKADDVEPVPAESATAARRLP